MDYAVPAPRNWYAIPEEERAARALLSDELWEAADIDNEPPLFGWLCTWLQGYPEPHEIRCHVHLRAGNLRPRIVLEPTAYPLAIEQHRGITLGRVQEIAAVGHFRSSASDR